MFGRSVFDNSRKAKHIGRIAALFVTAVLLVLAALAMTGCFYDITMTSSVLDEITVEAGTKSVGASNFITGSSRGAYLTDDSVYNLGKVGTYTVRLVYHGNTYEVLLKVVDTVVPLATPCNRVIGKNATVSAAELLTDVVDATEVTASFSVGFSTSQCGEKPYTVTVTDGGGNVTSVSGAVYVTESVNSVTWEIGSEFPAIGSFIPAESASFSTDPKQLVFNRPGKYNIGVNIGGGNYAVILDAADTVAPTASPLPKAYAVKGKAMPDPMSIVTGVVDATPVTAAYKSAYTTEKVGNQNVTVILTDAAGNTCEVTVVVSVRLSDVVDVTPPVIEVYSDTIEVEVGEKLDYSLYVEITDNVDGPIDVTDPSKCFIDESAYNNMLAGTYYLAVRAYDSSGNTSSSMLTISVKNQSIATDKVYELADKVIADIIKDTMTQEEKIRAVWTYCHDSPDFDHTGESNLNNTYITEGYYGFKYRVGDNYTCYCMCAVLLERLKIDFYTVRRVGNADEQYRWLLVDFGDGWYHVDPGDAGTEEVMRKLDDTPWESFKLTDAELTAFTLFYETQRIGWMYYDFNHATCPATPINNPDGSYTYLPYTVVYAAGEGGAVLGSESQEVYHGGRTEAVTATAGIGYRFVKWSDGGRSVSRTDIVNCSKTFTAIFEKSGTVINVNLIYTAQEGGTITGKNKQTVIGNTYGEEVTAVPGADFEFYGWSDGVMTATRRDRVATDLTVFAVFHPSSCTVEYSADAGGSVSGVTTQTWKYGVTGTAVVAVADAGYKFVRWSDGSTEPVRTDTFVGDISYIAYFEADESGTFALYYLASEGGIISGEAVQTVNAGESGTAVSAVAGEGYEFVAWSDGVTASERTDTPDKGLAVYAEFRAITPPPDAL